MDTETHVDVGVTTTQRVKMQPFGSILCKNKVRPGMSGRTFIYPNLEKSDIFGLGCFPTIRGNNGFNRSRWRSFTWHS